MIQPASLSSSQIFNQEQETSHLDNIRKFKGVQGRLMGFFGLALKVKDDQSHDEYYVRMKDLINELVERITPMSSKSKDLLSRRILEITDHDTRKPLSQEKLKDLFSRYFADKTKKPDQFKTETGIISEVEKLKQEMSEIKQLQYSKSLSEMVGHLKPGDILVRKIHDDNPNFICSFQKFFHKVGYREAYKCSHMAVYLGEIQGVHWISEASRPKGEEPHVRRLRIDDPRFDLMNKNQYLVIRNKDAAAAKETARLATKYSIKLLPESEKKTTSDDTIGSFTYNLLDAARSLWHFSDLAFYGRSRMLKYYTDYKNKIPFEYLGFRKSFFCSHFALIMESLSEMNKSDKFQKFIADHPLPKYDHTKTGIVQKLAGLGYSIQKGVWSRWMSFRYAHEIKSSVSTQLDALRTTPQDAVIYMMDHKESFDVVGMINHKSDLPGMDEIQTDIKPV